MDSYGYSFRAILITVGIVLFLIQTGLTVKNFKKLSLGQKLFALGVFGYQGYVMDGLREALEIGLGFRWRLAMLAIGQFGFIAYLLEPARTRAGRYGVGSPLRPDRDTPESGDPT